MDSINKLTEYFTRLPGVGPRQARRMVFYFLRQRRDFSEDVARLILDLKKNVSVCQTCFRHFVPTQPGAVTCSICTDPSRGDETLMIVEKDVDFENIERSGQFKGKYFILGGMYAPLAKNPEAGIRIDALLGVAQQRAKQGLKEIIIALAVNPDGEETARHITDRLSAALDTPDIKITTLGRGLSTGSELEYADSDTIKNAIESRT